MKNSFSLTEVFHHAKILFMMPYKKAEKPSGIKEKIIRLLEIYTLIAQNKYPSLKFLMERFNVSKRTIFSYNGLITIEYDFKKNYHVIRRYESLIHSFWYRGEL